MTRNCAEVQEMLAAYVRDGDSTLSFRRHLSRCQDCGAELRRYEGLVQGLSELRTVAMDPPPGLLPDLLEATPGRRDRVVRHVSRNRKRYVSGLAMTAAAGAAGALLLRNRSRSPLPA